VLIAKQMITVETLLRNSFYEKRRKLQYVGVDNCPNCHIYGFAVKKLAGMVIHFSYSIPTVQMFYPLSSLARIVIGSLDHLQYLLDRLSSDAQGLRRTASIPSTVSYLLLLLVSFTILCLCSSFAFPLFSFRGDTAGAVASSWCRQCGGQWRQGAAARRRRMSPVRTDCFQVGDRCTTGSGNKLPGQNARFISSQRRGNGEIMRVQHTGSLPDMEAKAMNRDDRLVIRLSAIERAAIERLAQAERLPALTLTRRMLLHEIDRRGLWPSPGSGKPAPNAPDVERAC
jgi:hypothetical protein